MVFDRFSWNHVPRFGWSVNFSWFGERKAQSTLPSPFPYPDYHALCSRNNSLVDDQHQPRYPLLGNFHRIKRHHYRLYRGATPLHAIPDAQSPSWIWVGVYLCHLHDGRISGTLHGERLDIPCQLRCQ